MNNGPILGYYGFVRDAQGYKIKTEEFTKKIPLMNRRAAFRWINEQKLIIDRAVPGYWDQCKYELGFFMNADMWPIYGNNRDKDLILLTLKKELEFYNEHGYNTGGPAGVIFHDLAGESYEVLKDSETFILI